MVRMEPLHTSIEIVWNFYERKRVDLPCASFLVVPMTLIQNTFSMGLFRNCFEADINRIKFSVLIAAAALREGSVGSIIISGALKSCFFEFSMSTICPNFQ